MPTDQELQAAVIQELKNTFIVHPNEISIAVHKGIVTLSGHIDSHLEKAMAEAVAKRTKGVKAVFEELKLRSEMLNIRTDEEIAAAVSNSLSGYKELPYGQIKIAVENGCVTLDGAVDSQVQKDLTTDIVKYIIGVKTVDNFLTIKAE